MPRTATHYVRCGDVLLTASEREYRVLLLLAAGLNMDEIGRLLKIHRSTVSTYAGRWMQQTGAQSRSALAMWALLTGFITPADIWSIWEAHAPQLAAWKQGEALE